MRWTYWVLVVGLVLAVVAPGGALAGSEPAGPIGGMIWQEINGTCSMDLDEPGLADVNLLLFDDVNNNGMIDEGTDQLVSEVVSEAGGFFTFDGITDGNYLVYLIDMNVPPELVLFYGDNPAQVSLAAGQSDYSTLFGFTGPGVMFSGNDSYTQGNWNGVYGNDAWLLSAGNAPTMNIQHVSQNCDTSAFDFSQSAVNGLKCGVETGLESEQRSLQLPNGEERRASVLFGGGVSNFVIEDLPPDNYMVAVYMVDYDRVGRLQRIRLETMTGYATVIVSSFGEGAYAVFSVDLTYPDDLLVITAQKLGATGNAVISGVFIDPLPGPPGVTFMELDRVTRGNWMGMYGSDWHVLFAQNLLPDLPGVGPSYTNSGYVTADPRDNVGGNYAGLVTYGVLNGFRYAWSETQGDDCGNVYSWIWATPGDDGMAPGTTTIDPRALMVPELNGRVPAAWNDGGERYPGVGYPNLYVHLEIPAGYFLMAIYALDFDNGNRSQTYSLFNADTGQLLGAGSAALNGGGKYSLFNVVGPLNLTIEAKNTTGTNAVISGLFFDLIGSGC